MCAVREPVAAYSALGADETAPVNKLIIRARNDLLSDDLATEIRNSIVLGQQLLVIARDDLAAGR